MRLLKVTDLTIEEFAPNAIPIYAILSHTWGSEEVILQDFQNGLAISKLGFSKIKHACVQAAKDDFTYIWIDTCCIDRTSSAELSEAINSMFQWYQNADVCYTYLADVSKDDEYYHDGSQFRISRWFTRGWTLQELIAPSEIIFFSHDWCELNRKSGVRDLLWDITGISPLVLAGSSPKKFSAAQRMSWASGRQTTRPEDVAYCLMGIFDVNMPLLYGEGCKAFMRLQHEIIKASDDHTIFAWKEKETMREGATRGLLANSPDEFSEARDVFALSTFHDRISIPSEITNIGLRVGFVLVRSALCDATTFLVPVGGDKIWNLGRCYSIIIRRSSGTGDQYSRIQSDVLDTSIKVGSSPNLYIVDGQLTYINDNDARCNYASIFVRPEPPTPKWYPYFRVPMAPMNSSRLELRDIYPPTVCDTKDKIIDVIPTDISGAPSEGFIVLAVLRYCHGSSNLPDFVRTNGIIVGLGLKFEIENVQTIPKRWEDISQQDIQPWCNFFEPIQGEYPSLMQIFHTSASDELWKEHECFQKSVELPVRHSFKCLSNDHNKHVQLQLVKHDQVDGVEDASYELKLSVV